MTGSLGLATRTGLEISLGSALAALGQGGGNVAPAGYGFLQIGSPSSYQTLRVGADSSAPRILIPTGA